MHDLLYNAGIATGESFNRGALVSLDSDGNLVAGAGSHKMPMWAKNSSDDYDVSAQAGGFTGDEPGCYVATGGFELYTTEYVAGTYVPGSTLLAAATGDDAGKVTAAAAQYSDDDVIGCVSKGTQEDESYNQDVLYFWPTFIPTIAP